MAKKTTISFVCQECGYDTPSWMGKCPECGQWNSLKEIRNVPLSASTPLQVSLSPGDGKPKPLKEIVFSEKSRIQTEYEELNTVLGGGIVRGAAMLIAGDPGVGKSTLLLQLCLSLAGNEMKVLYISGEESAEQIKMRADRITQNTLQGVSRVSHVSRVSQAATQEENEKKAHDTHDTHDTRDTLGKGSIAGENLLLVSLTNADTIVQQIDAIKPDLVIIDSIQTIESQNVSGLSGSVAQVRYAALQFVRLAKQLNIPIMIVGHVTKEGMVAGPMVLSHMVDTVLFLEGEKFAKTRILRSLKNRFGPVDEVGIFLMEEDGMVEAKNPEQLFLDGGRSDVPGSVLVATLEGSRAFLVELQALAVSSKLPMPRRVVSGTDPRRVELLLAVLQKHCRLPVDSMDVFVNVAGGLKLSDPGIDLGICLAVYSSLQNVPMTNTVGIAEVGLLGELRTVPGLEKRIREAEKMGFKNVITAKSNKSLREVMQKFGK